MNKIMSSVSEKPVNQSWIKIKDQEKIIREITVVHKTCKKIVMITICTVSLIVD